MYSSKDVLSAVECQVLLQAIGAAFRAELWIHNALMWTISVNSDQPKLRSVLELIDHRNQAILNVAQQENLKLIKEND